jgi:acyl-CoA synthetase (AMP-forming)/AMP-acid ligase II
MQRTAPFTLPNVLRAHAEQTPDAVAIATPDHAPLTYEALFARIETTVRTLHGLGIGPSDRVGLALPSGPDLAVAVLAVASGAIGAPLNPGAGKSELQSALSGIRARALIVPSGSDAPPCEAARGLGIDVLELSPVAGASAGAFTVGAPDSSVSALSWSAGSDDVAVLLSTSGTTSRPRVVPLTHCNMLTGAANIAASLDRWGSHSP